MEGCALTLFRCNLLLVAFKKVLVSWHLPRIQKNHFPRLHKELEVDQGVVGMRSSRLAG